MTGPLSGRFGALARLVAACAGFALAGLFCGNQVGGGREGAPVGGEGLHELAARLLESGEFERLMEEARLPPGSNQRIDLDGFDRLRRLLLQKAGTSWDRAGVAARDAATAAAFEGLREVERRHGELRSRALRLRDSPEFKRLVQQTAAGFEDLSSKQAFLDEPEMARLAEAVVRQHFPQEPDAVRASLAGRMKDVLWETTTAARTAFRRHVRFVFFGEEGFGTREDFLTREGQEERRQAIEQALWRALRQHPRYGRTLEVSFTKSVVDQQARDLAETLKTVPAPRKKK